MANILIQWILISTMALVHPFFVSVIEIEHNSKESTAEISIRVFTEDLEKTLQKYSSAKIDLIQANNKIQNGQELTSYIGKNLQLKINGQTVTAKYIGYEIVKESTWTYFEVEDVKEIKKIDINCTLLYDFEKSQINIFHIKNKGQEKNYKLDQSQRTTSFNF